MRAYTHDPSSLGQVPTFSVPLHAPHSAKSLLRVNPQAERMRAFSEASASRHPTLANAGRILGPPASGPAALQRPATISNLADQRPGCQQIYY